MPQNLNFLSGKREHRDHMRLNIKPLPPQKDAFKPKLFGALPAMPVHWQPILKLAILVSHEVPLYHSKTEDFVILKSH